MSELSWSQGLESGLIPPSDLLVRNKEMEEDAQLC